MENMKLRRAKEADQDICAIKTPYFTNQEEFIHETGFDGFCTQQEHAANWFYIKTINGLEDMSFSSQGPRLIKAHSIALYKLPFNQSKNYSVYFVLSEFVFT